MNTNNAPIGVKHVYSVNILRWIKSLPIRLALFICSFRDATKASLFDIKIAGRGVKHAAATGCDPDNKRSGGKGISWDKTWQKWVVRRTIDGERILIGRFSNLEEAKLAAEKR